MPVGLLESLRAALPHVSGFIYPNELELQWSVLIVLYPYITGLVAGAFILASLERVFNVAAVKPTYRLSLLTALAFLLIAPLPLQAHLGHPERSYEIFMTPNPSSAMAMFGFVYLWYLMAVLLMEIWLDYRREIVEWSQTEPFWPKRLFYKLLTFGVTNLSPRSLEIDDKLGKAITVIGLPSAVLLHGYVGFIFGSVKANPWWSTPLMPIIFLMSAIVSGIAMLIVTYYIVMVVKKQPVDNNCLRSLYKYLWGFFIIDLTLEQLGEISMAYSKSESWSVVEWMLEDRLHFSYTILQMGICSVIPLVLLGFVALKPMADTLRNRLGLICSALILVQVLAMRWNVVIGGQLFSKSLRGLTSYAPAFLGREGILVAAGIFAMPFVVMYVFNLILPLFESPADQAGR